MEQAVSTIIKFSFIPTLLVAAYTGYVFKKLPYELKVFARFIFLSGLIELISRIYWFNSKNNMPLLHIYVAAGFLFLTQFYQEVLKGFINKNIIRATLIAFLVFTTVNSLFVQSIFTFNSYALTVESVLIIIFSLSTYMLMLNDIVRENRLHLVKSLNWINSGLFIYYSSSLLIFHFGNLITLFAPSSLVKYTWMLHSFFSIVMYCCFFVGLWNRPRN
jgi:hypothetical protein